MPIHIAPEFIIDATLYTLLIFSVDDVDVNFFQNLAVF